MKNIVFTGGTGMLGTAMKEHFKDAHFPPRTELDLHTYGTIEFYFKYVVEEHNIDTIVHLAAETNTKGIETTEHGSIRAIETNIIATAEIARYCIMHDIHLVYMSTDYVYGDDDGYNREDFGVDPCNKYAWSKLGGEASVKLCNKHTIVRGSFGEDIFPYPKAYRDIYTSKIPVSEFAKRLAKVINYSNDGLGVINIGDKPQSVFDYAKQTNPDVEPMEVDLVQGAYKFPKDTSLNCTYYDEMFGDLSER
jgi:dTDP-4-dehydrorhamnose reductase